MINTFTDLYCRRIGYVDVDATCTTYWEHFFFQFFFLSLKKRVDRFCVRSVSHGSLQSRKIPSNVVYSGYFTFFLCNVPVESRGTSQKKIVFVKKSTMTSTQCCLPPEKSLKIIRWVEVRPLTPSWCFALSLSLVSSVRSTTITHLTLSLSPITKRRWRESWSRSFERYMGAL
jgi:hypothetical protein